LIWQTGKAFFATAQQACNDFKDAGTAAYAFITRMDYAYASADLVISRAGAIAISEICVTKKPAILIPSPNVAEDHQTKNALSLSKKTAAILVKDNEARDILVKEAIGLINDKQMCEKIVSNITRFAHKNAADSIADIILDMIKKQE
jgi:UDP-N-acetylglucosamine--N-acetylmuramyl-(pentapeptide) pyrophosphoryl-undecaprenol N-acetylglucosamine transferase